jgi:hypothetical protein
MPVDVGKTLRSALTSLKADRRRLDRQMEAIEAALKAIGEGGRGTTRDGRRRGGRQGLRRGMSAAARKAVSMRMKAYWAERRDGAVKPKRRRRARSAG